MLPHVVPGAFSECNPAEKSNNPRLKHTARDNSSVPLKNKEDIEHKERLKNSSKLKELKGSGN